MSNIVEYLNYINKYSGLNVINLHKEFSLETKAKNVNHLLIKKMLDCYSGKNIWKIYFELNSICLKTINLNEKNFPEESMSFPAFNFENLLTEKWETSILKKQFSCEFFFVVFKRTKANNVLLKAFLWKMPNEDLEVEVKKVWVETQEVLKSGNIVKKVDNNKIKLNFPSEANNEICHVRPHGRNGLDLTKLPNYDKNTNLRFLPKHAFWLSKKYLDMIIKSNIEMEE